MISDSNLERSSQWGVFTGPGIGGPVPYVGPTSFTIGPPSELQPWMQVQIVGPGYTDGMAALHRPLMPVFDPANVPLSLSFDLMTDGNAPTKAQAIEFEACVCFPGGTKYGNGSVQLNYVNPAGEVQAFTAADPWADTGIMLGHLTPLTAYRFKVNYLMNWVAATMSIVSLEVDGTVYPLPEQFQNTPALEKNPPWAPGVYVQYQLDLAFAGGAFSVFVRNVEVNWG